MWIVALLACAPPAHETLEEAAPPPEVLGPALAAYRCAVERGDIQGPALAVIDFSRASLRKRLWLLHGDTGHVERMHVTHGRASGGQWATMFSNTPDSNQSSLGLFRGAEVYTGRHGRSLRLDGLEPGVNDHARDRAIVVHGADYATLRYGLLHGRLGRSLGCPAVAPGLSDHLIDALAEGGALFAWYPDERWLSTSTYLHCS